MGLLGTMIATLSVTELAGTEVHMPVAAFMYEHKSVQWCERWSVGGGDIASFKLAW